MRLDHSTTLPVLIHGDAAFAAQGVVAETLNLVRLDGYATGGTVHIIANNQVGFTTGPREGRSTDYSSDLAKGFDIPIIHVNADDPEACLAAARLAMMYRERFGNDIVIDLVGYRRYGHNEGDEPAYSQPAMYESIAKHESVREMYQAQLVESGAISADKAEALVKAAQRDLAKRQASVRKGAEEPQGELDRGSEAIAPEEPAEPETAVAIEELRDANAGIGALPDGFNLHPKLGSSCSDARSRWMPTRRRSTGATPSSSPSPRSCARARRSGSPARTPCAARSASVTPGCGTRRPARGTSRSSTSPAHGRRSSSTTRRCPSTRASASSTATPSRRRDALVLWEAQYGDFVNGAEIIIDQFLVSGLAKWRQTSRLTLLLPHGYEGSGPEHSSARLERFLALGAEGNIRVVYPPRRRSTSTCCVARPATPMRGRWWS